MNQLSVSLSALQAQALADLQETLSTRTVAEFAAEARIDGESLQQALERYEVDYAWHVLGSERLREQTLSELEDRLQRAANDEQRACVSDILRTAADSQASDRLMSFDNDVPAQLGQLLGTWFEREAVAAV